jgi:uncharacterized coiled-coil protein SlyX
LEHNIFREISLRSDLEYTIKDLECENEKQSHKIKQLEKELIKTGTVEEKIITEIVTRENMKNEYDTLIKSLKQKQEILVKEKEESKVFYEKKIETLNESIQEKESKDKQSQQEIKMFEGKFNQRKSGKLGKTFRLKSIRIERNCN